MFWRVITPLKNLVLSISGLALFFLLWELAPRQGWVNARYLPGFSQTLLLIGQMWVSGEIFPQIIVSLWRVVNGLLIAVTIGLPLGIMLGRAREPLIEASNPLLRVLSQANPFSLMPVFILFFGIGEVAKLAVVAWVCIWPILFNTITGVKTIDPSWIKTARSMGISAKEMVLKVLLPGATPAIFTGLKIGIQMAFFMLIVAEMIGSNAGLGYLLHISAALYQIPRVYAASLCIILLGTALNLLLLFLEKSVFFWNETADPAFVHSDSRILRLLGRYGLLFVLALLIGIITFGSWQVQEVAQNETMYHHHHSTYNVPTRD